MFVKSVAIALTCITAATFVPTEAQACGNYGDFAAPSQEELATRDVWAILVKHDTDHLVEQISVTLTDVDRGIATIRLRESKQQVRFGLRKIRRRWQLTRMDRSA